MTAPDFPDVPDLLAQMRARDDVDAPRLPITLATIQELANRQSPEQKQAAREYADRVELGLDALDLGETYLEQGELDAAARWFAVAVRYDACGARAELEAVEQLQAALAEPGIPDDSVLGPAPLERRPHDDVAARGISTYTLDWADREADRITAEARIEAAAIVQNAESSATDLVVDAENDAARIRSEARRDAEMIRARASDGGQDQTEGTDALCVPAKLPLADSIVLARAACQPNDRLAEVASSYRGNNPLARGIWWMRPRRAGGLVWPSRFLDGRDESLVRRWITRPRSVLYDLTQSLNLIVPSLSRVAARDERLPLLWDGPRTFSKQEYEAIVEAVMLAALEHLASGGAVALVGKDRADITIVNMSDLGALAVTEVKGFGSTSVTPTPPVSDPDELIVITDVLAP